MVDTDLQPTYSGGKLQTVRTYSTFLGALRQELETDRHADAEGDTKEDAR